MSERYTDWIERYLDRCDGMPLGRCSSATLEMVKAFPELKRVPGRVYYMGRETEHWWCEAPDGSVVDPTAAQFHGITTYIPWKPGDEVCVGKCMNCGDYIYRASETLSGGREMSCSPQCEAELVEAFG